MRQTERVDISAEASSNPIWNNHSKVSARIGPAADERARAGPARVQRSTVARRVFCCFAERGIQAMKKKFDAIALLEEGHHTVSKLFKQFKTASNADDNAKKSSIVDEIIAALEVHATIEEEIFYPAVKRVRAERAKDEVREAFEEHKQIKTLLAALGDSKPGDETFDAKVKVLQEDVEHHVKEEEGEMFPDAKKFLGKERLEALGERLAMRKQELENDSMTKDSAISHAAAK
jgi:hemerythrin superfamily protein